MRHMPQHELIHIQVVPTRIPLINKLYISFNISFVTSSIALATVVPTKSKSLACLYIIKNLKALVHKVLIKLHMCDGVDLETIHNVIVKGFIISK